MRVNAIHIRLHTTSLAEKKFYHRFAIRESRYAFTSSYPIRSRSRPACATPPRNRGRYFSFAFLRSSIHCPFPALVDAQWFGRGSYARTETTFARDRSVRPGAVTGAWQAPVMVRRTPPHCTLMAVSEGNTPSDSTTSAIRLRNVPPPVTEGRTYTALAAVARHVLGLSKGRRRSPDEEHRTGERSPVHSSRLSRVPAGAEKGVQNCPKCQGHYGQGP